MSQYIKVFNTRDEYNEWLSGYTEGYAVSAYIISENATVGKEYTPFLTASADTTSFAYPATSTTLHIKSNLNWTLTKPSWVTVNTSGSCAADLTMAIAANDESKNPRSGNVVISYNQTSSQTISLTQAGNPSYTGISDNEIWYTTSGDTVMSPYKSGTDIFGANIVSNTYSSGKGVITFDGSVTKFGDRAFGYKYDNLTSIVMPNSITECDSGSLIYATGLSAITFSHNTETLPSITSSKITELNIPDSVTALTQYQFSSNGLLNKIIVGSGLTSVGSQPFQNCTAVTEVYYASPTVFGVFNAINSSLTNVTLTNTITINSSAFLYCVNLSNINIPSTVTSIGSSAFWHCSGLTSFTCNAVTPPTLGSLALTDTNDCPIYVPSASVDTYKAASGWSTYASRIQAIPE